MQKGDFVNLIYDKVKVTNFLALTETFMVQIDNDERSVFKREAPLAIPCFADPFEAEIEKDWVPEDKEISVEHIRLNTRNFVKRINGIQYYISCGQDFEATGIYYLTPRERYKGQNRLERQCTLKPTLRQKKITDLYIGHTFKGDMFLYRVILFAVNINKDSETKYFESAYDIDLTKSNYGTSISVLLTDYKGFIFTLSYAVLKVALKNSQNKKKIKRFN